MRILKIALAFLMITSLVSMAAMAKNEPKTAYMFGFASSFNDSTVYITSVQQVDSVTFTNKGRFLDSRENYSFQLRDYLESIGAGHRTCIVIFDKSQKKAEKKWNKLYNRYTQKPKAKKLKNGQKKDDIPTPYQMKSISNGEFVFKHVEPMEEAVPVKMSKKEKKELKAKNKPEKGEKGKGRRNGFPPAPKN